MTTKANNDDEYDDDHDDDTLDDEVHCHKYIFEDKCVGSHDDGGVKRLLFTSLTPYSMGREGGFNGGGSTRKRGRVTDTHIEQPQLPFACNRSPICARIFSDM